MLSRANTLIILLTISLLVPARDGGRGDGTQLYFAPAVGFYSINQKHATAASPRLAILAGFKRELRASRDYRTYVSFGCEYFYHGLSFRSYYFRPDSIKLYDGSFRFQYRVAVHEFGVPLQLKVLLKRADNSLYSPYVTAGYHLRYLLSSDIVVDEGGSVVKRDHPAMRFRTPFIDARLNSYVSAGVGFQRNSVRGAGGAFFAEAGVRYGFSSWTFDADYAPSSLWMGNTHLLLLLGLRF
jgi:hypothetical protein